MQENADSPGALLLKLPVNRTSAGDLQFVGDGTFEPMTGLALTVTPGAAGAQAQCVFDGYVLSWRLHLDRASTSSAIEIWAQDASWLMNLDDNVTEWSGQTDGEIANSIFGTYGFTPADGNTDNDSPSHTDDGHTLLQRATDLQFLRGLARRGGKLCRVACTDTPGARTGYFVTPDVTGQPAATISLLDPAELDRRLARLRLGRDAPDPGGREPGRPDGGQRLRHRHQHGRQRAGPARPA